MPELVIPGMGHPSHDRRLGQIVSREVGGKIYHIPSKFADLTDADRRLLTGDEIAEMRALAREFVPRDLPAQDRDLITKWIDEHTFKPEGGKTWWAYDNALQAITEDRDLEELEALLLQCCLFGRIPNNVLAHALKRDQLFLFERNYTVTNRLVNARRPSRIRKILAPARAVIRRHGS